MKIQFIGLLAAVAALAAGATNDRPRVSFASLDKDRDGGISVAEATASRGLSRAFMHIDVDGDSQVSAREYAEWVRIQTHAGLANDSVGEQARIPPPRTQYW